MPLFTKDDTVVEAYLWMKNGDHPKDYVGDVEGIENGAVRLFTGEERKKNEWEGSFVRYYRHPNVDGESKCAACDNRFNSHGWIDQGDLGVTVCPGNVVVSKDTGETITVSYNDFGQTYKPAFNAIFIPK